MRRILFSLLLFLGFSTFRLHAQIRSFSNDTSVFIKEFSTFMQDGADDKRIKNTLTFVHYWQQGKFTPELKLAIRKTYNTLRMANFPQEPECNDLMINYMLFVEQGIDEEAIANFHRILDKVFAQNKNQFGEYILWARNLFLQGIIFQDKARTWVPSNLEYELVYENAPIVKFKDWIDLSCLTNGGDTLLVRETKGSFNFYTREWQGKSGIMDWRRVGFDTTMVYAEFGKYKVNVASNEFKIDTATFYNKLFFSYPLSGTLIDKVSAGHLGEKSRYPQFNSFSKIINLKNFIQGVEYTGGFQMKGGDIIGIGTGEQKARLNFYYRGKLRAWAEGVEFVIRPNRIVSDRVRANFYLVDSAGKMDSVFHQSVRLNFNFDNRTLIVSRSSEGVQGSPFFDSYHRAEINADELSWVIDDPRYDFRMSNPDKAAVLESFNYYRQSRFEQIQSILDYNPIDRVRNFCMSRKNGHFTLEEYAQYCNNKPENVKGQLILLADKGFIYYDPVTETVDVRNKIFEYFNSNMGTTDYDVMRFSSIIAARPNFTIDLVANSLTMEGVGSIIFSDSQDVYVIPDDQQVKMLKNRDLEFSGLVHAGRFDFFGKNYEFDYPNFKINLKAIDSLRFTVPSRENKDILVPVKTVLQDIYGTLYIDKENNKSGKKNYPEYPKFVAEKGAFVYYDREDIAGGAYDRSKFFFHTDPFTFDSLDNFTLEGIHLEGEFVSGGIYPDFRYQLEVMDDYSLGFIKNIPEGVPTYNGKGTTSGQIKLSNDGLWGSGKIEYLSSVGHSDKYILLPDSAVGPFQTWVNTRDDKTPDVTAVNTQFLWAPNQDVMNVTQVNEQMQVFGNKASMMGTLSLAPKGMSGVGRLNFDNAYLGSEDFRFKPMSVSASSAGLQIYGYDTMTIALRTTDVNAFVDFDTKLGTFKTNQEGNSVSFPYHQYTTSLGDFKWDINQKILEFKPPTLVDYESPYMLSLHPRQDSLIFETPQAFYDLKDYRIRCKQVPYIAVADAHVFPDSGNVTIEPMAIIAPLFNSKMVCDTIEETHHMYDCEMYIIGKLKFEGKGVYDYTDKNGKKQPIFLAMITDNRKGRTTAYGDIPDTANFTLGPKIGFKGRANLFSLHRDMEFDGFIRMKHNLPVPKTDAFRFTMRVNPDSVFIPFKEPKNENKQELFTGVGLSTDSTHLYPSFFNRKRSYSDAQVITNTGYIFYDDVEKQFVYGDSARIFGESQKGVYATFNEDNKLFYNEGPLNLGVNFGDLKLTSAGQVYHDMKDTSNRILTGMLIDFPIPKEAVKILADSIYGQNRLNSDSKVSRDFIMKFFAQILGEKEYDKLIQNWEENGKLEIPDELPYIFFFSQVQMKFIPKYKMYVSEGFQDLKNVGRFNINKSINIKITMEKKKSGDIFTLYIENATGTFYFFQYLRGAMNVVSSDVKFQDVIRELGKKSVTNNYKIRVGTARQMKTFLKTYEQIMQSQQPQEFTTPPTDGPQK